MKAFSPVLLVTVTCVYTAGAASILPGPTSSITGNGSISLSPDASVFADAVIDPGVSGGAVASLTYDLEVFGPANASAILDITGEAIVAYYDVDPGTYFNVSAGIALGGGGLQSAFCGSSYDPADCVLGEDDTIVQGVADNTVYQLHLSADV